MVLSVCVASIIRVPYIARLSLVDQTWFDVNGFIWSAVELNVAIVSACLPTLRPLFFHVFQGGYTTSRDRQSPEYRRPECPSPGRKVSAEDGLSDVASMTKHSDAGTSEWG